MFTTRKKKFIQHLGMCIAAIFVSLLYQQKAPFPRKENIVFGIQNDEKQAVTLMVGGEKQTIQPGAMRFVVLRTPQTLYEKSQLEKRKIFTVKKEMNQKSFALSHLRKLS
ncbi:MAG: hypothetical protein ACKVTZ_11350 [Bacteroidia bacterium]